MSITFIENPIRGYRDRTIKNASYSDITIAFAVDNTTFGEKLTKNSSKEYFLVDIKGSLQIKQDIIDELTNKLNKLYLKFERLPIIINIAGNGLYSMKNVYTQETLDKFMFDFFAKLIKDPNGFYKIKAVRSGGQTGIDEAGAKAANKHHINTIILAPNGWLFRDRDGNDIYDETKFKERF